MSARVLVVEDEPQIQELVAVNLEHAGYRVARAASAEEAQAAIRDELPDVVVLDWMLPGESGLSFARRLRGDARTRELPILILTARNETDKKVDLLLSGADDYLVKPFSFEELSARVHALLRRPSLHGRFAARVENFARDHALDLGHGSPGSLLGVRLGVLRGSRAARG